MSEQLALKFTQKRTSIRVSSGKKEWEIIICCYTMRVNRYRTGISHISRALLANTKSEPETNSVSSADESYPRRDMEKGERIQEDSDGCANQRLCSLLLRALALTDVFF